MAVLTETNFPNLIARGKVRDTYDLGDRLLIVTSDRISAFDVVLPNGIPDKGRVLNQLSAFWFKQTERLLPNHLIEVVTERTANPFPELPDAEWRVAIGRSMIVKKARRVDVECVARGYITGSGWASYRRGGEVSGIMLPPGLQEGEQLPEPIFTPTTKAETGHDEEITFEQVIELVGRRTAEDVRRETLSVYRFGADYARPRGIIIADTKMEFGYVDGELILIDELLTPDSSRFWPASEYQPGRPQPSFDKQYVRDWLTQNGWSKEPPAPELPPDVVERTAEKYREAYRLLTGEELV